MNKARRAKLNRIIDALETLQEDLAVITEEEENYRDNIPENMTSSTRYEKAETACDALNDALDAILDAVSSIEAAAE